MLLKVFNCLFVFIILLWSKLLQKKLKLFNVTIMNLQLFIGGKTCNFNNWYFQKIEYKKIPKR